MNRHFLCSAVSALSLVLLALGDSSNAASVRSGASRTTRVVVPATVVVPAPVTASPAPVAEDDYAYGALDETAVIRLRVPANAQVWFDGSETTQRGSLRPFVTPALEPDKDYTYVIRARWIEDGRPAEETRKVQFRSGDRLTLNMLPGR
jgi:uncharacterized protein (TIGR03000 family)